MDELYREVILDRYKNPKNRGVIRDGVKMEKANFLCGDSVEVFLKVDDGVVVEAKFMGGGCAISMAAVDMLMDKIVGMKVEEVVKMRGEEVEKMMGVKLTPARKRCAYLALEAIKKANFVGL